MMLSGKFLENEPMINEHRFIIHCSREQFSLELLSHCYFEFFSPYWKPYLEGIAFQGLFWINVVLPYFQSLGLYKKKGIEMG